MKNCKIQLPVLSCFLSVFSADIIFYNFLELHLTLPNKMHQGEIINDLEGLFFQNLQFDPPAIRHKMISIFRGGLLVKDGMGLMVKNFNIMGVP